MLMGMMPLFGHNSIQVHLSQTTLKQGQPLHVQVDSSHPLRTPTLLFCDHRARLFFNGKTPQGYRYRAYVAAPHHLKKGIYPLQVRATLYNNTSFVRQLEVRVAHPQQPKKGRVTLGKGAKRLAKDTAARKQEAALLSQVFQQVTPYRYFKGGFIRPATGRISSGFGKLRTYSSGNQSVHVGVDIANKTGTPIHAAAAGKVVLSATLRIHGHTVVIDHGWGVLSIYCHLAARSVGVGQYVGQGAVIGAMGKTGLASGTHLHWGVSVQDIRSDPLFWTQDGITDILTSK